MVTIREYRTTDKDDVMELIRRNTPEYFAAEEEIDLSDYLDREIELYYVLVTNDRIVGCGGINFADDKTVGKIKLGTSYIPIIRENRLGSNCSNIESTS